MKLIVILTGIAIEHFVGVADDIRRLSWFNSYTSWLERQMSGKDIWDGPAGVLLTLALPLIILLIAQWVIIGIFYPAIMLFDLLVLLYCLGPRYLNPELDRYITAVEYNDYSDAEAMARSFVINGEDEPGTQKEILGSIILSSNQRLFGVLFWFIILGPFGALLYRLSCILWTRQYDIHGAYSDAVRQLYNILTWPVARLLAFSYALTGNMMRAIEAWRQTESSSLQVNEKVMLATGFASLDDDISIGEMTDDEYIDALKSLRGLMNRTILLWLSVLGLMTLSGWLS